MLCVCCGVVWCTQKTETHHTCWKYHSNVSLLSPSSSSLLPLSSSPVPRPPSSSVPLPPPSPFLRVPQALRKLNVGFCPLVSEGGPSVPGEYLDSDEMTKEELEDEEHVTPMFPVPRRRRREKKVLSWVFVHC